MITTVPRDVTISVGTDAARAHGFVCAEGIPGKLKRVLGARVSPWHLKNVYVLPQLRGRGCGEMLVEGMAETLVCLEGASGGGGEEGVFVYLRCSPTFSHFLLVPVYWHVLRINPQGQSVSAYVHMYR